MASCWILAWLTWDRCLAVPKVSDLDGSDTSQARSDFKTSALESKCLRSLYTSDYESHKSRNPERVVGTLEWFLDHEKYRNWQEEKSGLLWVTADPGCGKSVLAAFLVDELKIQSSRRQGQTDIQDTPEVVGPRDTVCFFFFKDDNQEQKTATFALSALLHQLFSAVPDLLRHAMGDYKGKGEKFAQEFGTLWRIFKAATTDPKCGNVICIVDALDECEESTRNDLISSLVSMYTPTTRTDQMFLKFILTSRPYGWIERLFARLPSIRLKAEEQTPAISADIERVVKSEVEALGNARGLTVSDRINLRDKLIQGADQTFLWVSLVFRILNGSQAASRKRFLDTLNTLPSGLDSVYEKILGDSCDREEAKRILQMVVAATRPLTLDEMDIALAIQPDHKSIEDLEPYRLYSVETTVKEICGLFVKVIDSKIYLIHQTAKEFLMKSPTTLQAGMERSASTWKQSLCPVESNLTLAKSCIYYLLFSAFEARPLTPHARQREIHDFTKEHVFLDYAAKNWAAHVLEAEIWDDEELSTTALEVFQSGLGRLLTWFLVYKKAANEGQYFDTTNINSLAAASFIGHKAAVELLIEKGEDVNGCRSQFANALNVAALRKDRAVVKLLLNNGAIVYLYGREFTNLLEVNRYLSRPKIEAIANCCCA